MFRAGQRFCGLSPSRSVLRLCDVDHSIVYQMRAPLHAASYGARSVFMSARSMMAKRVMRCPQSLDCVCRREASIGAPIAHRRRQRLYMLKRSPPSSNVMMSRSAGSYFMSNSAA
jgi:hypothetical protein